MNRWIFGRPGGGDRTRTAVAARLCGVLVRWLIFWAEQWLG